MNIAVKPGKYVIAVSGGIDSMVLLDVLVKQSQHSGLELIVAHYDHGIRPDADEDRRLVEWTAEKYGLLFVCEHGYLGATASEAQARKARYDFLRRTKEKFGATAIITAHHQDDMLETAIINMLRGTGRKGLSSLRSTDEILRPLLQTSKQEIQEYAAEHPDVQWREDSTNANDRYLRNYIRLHLMPKISGQAKQELILITAKAAQANDLIDELLQKETKAHGQSGQLDRRWFIMLPHDVAAETMAAWLRDHGIRGFDRRTIERLTVSSKVADWGKRVDILAGFQLEVGRESLRLLR